MLLKYLGDNIKPDVLKSLEKRFDTSDQDLKEGVSNLGFEIVTKDFLWSLH